MSCSTIDTQDHKDWLPGISFQGPHVSVTILRAGQETVGLGSPVESSNDLVVLGELMLELEIVGSRTSHDPNLVVVG